MIVEIGGSSDRITWDNGVYKINEGLEATAEEQQTIDFANDFKAPVDIESSIVLKDGLCESLAEPDDLDLYMIELLTEVG